MATAAGEIRLASLKAPTIVFPKVEVPPLVLRLAQRARRPNLSAGIPDSIRVGASIPAMLRAASAGAMLATLATKLVIVGVKKYFETALQLDTPEIHRARLSFDALGTVLVKETAPRLVGAVRAAVQFLSAAEANAEGLRDAFADGLSRFVLAAVQSFAERVGDAASLLGADLKIDPAKIDELAARFVQFVRSPAAQGRDLLTGFLARFHTDPPTPLKGEYVTMLGEIRGALEDSPLLTAPLTLEGSVRAIIQTTGRSLDATERTASTIPGIVGPVEKAANQTADAIQMDIAALDMVAASSKAAADGRIRLQFALVAARAAFGVIDSTVKAIEDAFAEKWVQAGLHLAAAGVYATAIAAAGGVRPRTPSLPSGDQSPRATGGRGITLTVNVPGYSNPQAIGKLVADAINDNSIGQRSLPSSDLVLVRGHPGLDYGKLAQDLGIQVGEVSGTTLAASLGYYFAHGPTEVDVSGEASGILEVLGGIASDVGSAFGL